MGSLPVISPITYRTMVLHISFQPYPPQVGQHWWPRHSRGAGPRGRAGGQPYGILGDNIGNTSTGAGYVSYAQDALDYVLPKPVTSRTNPVPSY